jgi:hypothetical protein
MVPGFSVLSPSKAYNIDMADFYERRLQTLALCAMQRGVTWRLFQF